MTEQIWAFAALIGDEAFNPGFAFWAAFVDGGRMHDGDAAGVGGGHVVSAQRQFLFGCEEHIDG
jgi:hypothetical protein